MAAEVGQELVGAHEPLVLCERLPELRGGQRAAHHLRSPTAPWIWREQALPVVQLQAPLLVRVLSGLAASPRKAAIDTF